MKVDSMDARTYISPFEKTSKADLVQKSSEQTGKSQENLKPNLEQKDGLDQHGSVDDKILIEAIEKANKQARSENTSFSFSVHEGTKRITVKVVDEATDEIVKEFPPEKILDMVAKMWEFAGLFVDEKR